MYTAAEFLLEQKRKIQKQGSCIHHKQESIVCLVASESILELRWNQKHKVMHATYAVAFTRNT